MKIKSCTHCHGKVFRGKYFEVDYSPLPVFLHTTCVENYKKFVSENLGREVEFKEVDDLKWNFVLKVYH